MELDNEGSIVARGPSSGSIGGDEGAVAIDKLLDENWFYSGGLEGRKRVALPKSSSTSSLVVPSFSFLSPSSSRKFKEGSIGVAPQPQVSSQRVEDKGNLLRVSSLPVDFGKPVPNHNEAIPPKPSLQRSYSTTEKSFPSLSSRGIRHSENSSSKGKPPRDDKINIPSGHNHENNHNTHIRREKSLRRPSQSKRWKSLDDLEHEEVQGFKDLGFVFDNKEVVTPEILNVIPGLRSKESNEKTVDEARRRYISESWLLQRLSQPPVSKWMDQRSPDDVKQKLRFWARAVASNVQY